MKLRMALVFLIPETMEVPNHSSNDLIPSGDNILYVVSYRHESQAEALPDTNTET